MCVIGVWGMGDREWKGICYFLCSGESLMSSFITHQPKPNPLPSIPHPLTPNPQIDIPSPTVLP